MKNTLKKYWKQILFTALGAFIGLAYYLVGCANGSCIIGASPYTSMIYVGIIGWLISNVVGEKEHNS